MRPPALVLMLAASALLTGCGPGGVDVIAAMEMQVVPRPVDWRADPAPDGLQVQIRFYSGQPVRAVTVNGTLELLLFQGVVPAGRIAQAKPMRTWSFAGRPLRELAEPDLVGCYHMLRLDWGNLPPPVGSVTLIARYRPPEGQWLYSRPNSSIVIGPR